MNKVCFHRFYAVIALSVLCLMNPGPICAEKVISPEEFFGFQVGADLHLIDYGEAVSYWRKLSTQSNKIKLFNYGKSSFERDMIFAAVSSEENLSRLAEYKDIARKLSQVRGLSDDEAKRLSSEGKAIVWIDGGLHATEVSPAQHIIQLSYDLLTDPSAKNQRILDETIVMLVLPNPDGMDMVAQWYRGNLGTPYETSSIPGLYQKYIGHDNNRDSFMLSVAETRNMNHIIYHDWYPQVFYNHHQRAPFPSLIFVPPDCEPTNPNLHPLLLRWQSYIGAAIAKGFETEQKQGVISRFLFDTWYPGYVTQICDFHNIISTFSETFLYHYATPHFYTVDDFPESYKEFVTSIFFTNPWRGGWWHLRDAVEYDLTASKSVLDLAAKEKEELLFDKYAMGKETINKYLQEPPFGWIVPRENSDRAALSQLLDILILLDIEIYQAEESFKSDGITHPENTYILPTSQPYGRLLKTLFEIQSYPDLRRYPDLWQSIVEPIKLSKPPLRTYDVLGWTLPAQMGVKTVTMNSLPDVRMKRLTTAPEPEDRWSGTGNKGILIPYSSGDCIKAVSRILKAGGHVSWLKKAFSQSGRTFPPGSFYVPLSGISRGQIQELVEGTDIDAVQLKNMPGANLTPLKIPRTALYKPWTANMDEGWTRLILERYEIPFQTITNAEMKAGRLRERCDAIIFPDQRPGSILSGHRKGTMPPKYVGGISTEGVRSIKDFLEAGGTLITLGDACDFPIEQFKLPVKNVVKPLKPEEFFASGVLMNANFKPDHPVAYGMPDQGVVFFADSPTFQAWPAQGKHGEPKIFASYPGEDIIFSGWMNGEKFLRNKAGGLEVPYGQGRVILLGFRTQHRAQTVSTFRLLFNAIFYSTVDGIRGPSEKQP